MMYGSTLNDKGSETQYTLGGGVGVGEYVVRDNEIPINSGREEREGTDC